MIDVYVLLIGGGSMYAPLWEDLAARQELTYIADCLAFVREADSGEIVIAFSEEEDQHPAFDALLAYLQRRKSGSALTISVHRQHERPADYGGIALARGQGLRLAGNTRALAWVVDDLSSDELHLNTVLSALSELRKDVHQAIWRIRANER